MEAIHERPDEVSLLSVLKACDTQDGQYPAAPSLAQGLSMIAIGLLAVESRLEAIVDEGEHLPLEIDQLANTMFNRGAAAFSMLHRLTLET